MTDQDRKGLQEIRELLDQMNDINKEKAFEFAAQILAGQVAMKKEGEAT